VALTQAEKDAADLRLLRASIRPAMTPRVKGFLAVLAAGGVAAVMVVATLGSRDAASTARPAAPAPSMAFAQLSGAPIGVYPATKDDFLSRLQGNWPVMRSKAWGPLNASLQEAGNPPWSEIALASGETLSATEIQGRLTEVNILVEYDKAPDADLKANLPITALIDAASPGLSRAQIKQAVDFLNVALVRHSGADVSVPGADIGIDGGPSEFEMWLRPTGHRLDLALEAHNRMMPGDAKPSERHLVIR